MVYYIYRNRLDSGLMCCESAFKLAFDMVVFCCFTKNKAVEYYSVILCTGYSNGCKDVNFDTWPKDVEH